MLGSVQMMDVIHCRTRDSKQAVDRSFDSAAAGLDT